MSSAGFLERALEDSKYGLRRSLQASLEQAGREAAELAMSLIQPPVSHPPFESQNATTSHPGGVGLALQKHTIECVKTIRAKVVFVAWRKVCVRHGAANSREKMGNE